MTPLPCHKQLYKRLLEAVRNWCQRQLYALTAGQFELDSGVGGHVEGVQPIVDEAMGGDEVAKK